MNCPFFRPHRRPSPHALTGLVPAALLALFAVSPARAAILNVPSVAYPTIQAAVNAAANGDTVAVADGTYRGDGNRDIDFGGKSLTVASASGDATRAIIDCGGNSSADHRGFYIHRGETHVVISGFTVRNGYESASGGGICLVDSGALIQNCIVSGNTAKVYGGGIYSDNVSTETIAMTGCTASGNTAYEGGGGVYNLNNSTGTITMTGCTVSANNAQDYGGGGVYNLNSSNSSNNSTGTITMTGCTVSANTTNSYGGGVHNDNYYDGNGTGTITMIGCTVSANTALKGGGVYDHSGSSSTIALMGCAVSANTAQTDGGGVFNFNDLNENATIALTNCTLSANSAGIGGGVENFNDGVNGTTILADCTVSANTAQQGSGIFNNNFGGTGTGTIALNNCVLFGDSGVELANAVNTSANAATAYCDIQGGYPGTGNINADPLFVYAAGGNLHLQPGSPCLGAGTSTGAPATDKDGVTRPSRPSIGAYEATPSHTHLLWNNSDGRVMLWNVAADGTFTLHGFGPYTDDYVSSDPNNKWHATALASAPDGTSRIVWNNVDRRVMLWSLDAQGNILSVTGYGPYTDTSVSSSPANLWSAVGVSVGPDGLTHLLWGNTDRRMMFWDLDAQGNLLGLTGYGPYTDDYVSSDPANVWSATALATGPDNVSRVVWNNVDHRVMLWTLGGPGGSSVRGIAGYGPYTDNSPQNLWSAVGVSVGPDNQTHLLWSNTDRRAMLWNVDSAFGFTLAGYGPYTDDAPQNLWTATALATGPDGLSHLLWGNTDYRAMLWGINSAFSFTVAGYGPYTDNAPGNLWTATAVSAGP